MQLIIVESPTKAKTLGRFLGKEYQLMATMGHLRDLPGSQLGVEVEKGFAPVYEVVEDEAREREENHNGRRDGECCARTAAGFPLAGGALRSHVR